MISSKMASSIIRPNSVLYGAAKKPDMMTRIMKSNPLGKVCELAEENPVLTNALFSLGICCAARPVTNYLTTKNKKDAAYASGHSISSGAIGAVWSLAIATPLANAVRIVLGKPQKYLKPAMIKKLFPTVGIKEVIKDGKKIQEVMENSAGKMIRKDGTELLRDFEPLKIRNGDAPSKLKELEKKLEKTKKQSKIDKLNEEKEVLKEKIADFEAEKIKFETENPNLYVDKNGVVRSREIFKTKDGKFQFDEDGSRSITGEAGGKMGCVVQKDKTPITEEMENGAQKEKNIETIFKWVPDIILAPPRAFLTIVAIPPILKGLGLEKSKKGAAPAANTANSNNSETKAIKAEPVTAKVAGKHNVFTSLRTHIASTPKKGGN